MRVILLCFKLSHLNSLERLTPHFSVMITTNRNILGDLFLGGETRLKMINWFLNKSSEAFKFSAKNLGVNVNKKTKL